MKRIIASSMLLAVAASFPTQGCYANQETTCGQESADPARMTGTTVNGRGGAPLANVHVYIELCERYGENPNPGKGHPNYRLGAVSDKNGRFDLMVPRGTVGIHSFKPYFQYGTVAVNDSATDVTVPMEPNDDRPNPMPAAGTLPECVALATTCDKCPRGTLNDQCAQTVMDNVASVCSAASVDPKYASCIGRTPPLRPVLSNLTVTPTRVKTGQSITLTVTAKADLKDPLSEEVLVLQPETHLARAFDPPLRGEQGRGFANGQWKLTLAAPSTKGSYRYYGSVSSEGCVTGVGEPMLNPDGSPMLDVDRTPMREQPYVTVEVE